MRTLAVAGIAASLAAVHRDGRALWKGKAQEAHGLARVATVPPKAQTAEPFPSVRPWRYATASAYSLHETSTRQGCPGAPALTDRALSVATFLVGCGRRLVVCYGRRCVKVRRWDSGPYVRGRSLDLNLGVVRALGFPSCAAWGVRTVRWRAA